MVKNISSTEAKLMYDNKIKFIDVREEAEYTAARIPNTILIPMSEIQYRISEIPKNEDVVIYCKIGNRSENLISQLIHFGYINLYNLEGGIVDWHKNNFPVEFE